MTAQKIELPEKEITELCRRYQVRELAVFGSFVRGDFRPDSDIDLLVEFAPEAEVGFLTLARMGRELSNIFHRQVDLVPKGGLKPRIRKEVLESRRVLYAA
jgi:predicted nucleotidyltransferase